MISIIDSFYTFLWINIQTDLNEITLNVSCRTP
jgi:hypothetical protein